MSRGALVIQCASNRVEGRKKSVDSVVVDYYDNRPFMYKNLVNISIN